MNEVELQKLTLYSPETDYLEEKIESKKKCLYIKLLSLCMIFLCMVSTAIIITVVVVVVVTVDNPSTVYPDSNQDIHITSEYQIKIVFDDSWINRSSVIDKWMEYFEEQCKYYSSNEVDIEADIRRQYSVDLSGDDSCGFDYYIRVRDYISGPKSGTTTVDIKGNSSDEEEAKDLPFWPSDNFKDNSQQKCEKDFHECSSKYSRETRITFEEETKFNTCLDIVQLYPYAFDGMPVTKLWNPVESSSKDTWYIREYTGTLNETTDFKIAFTLKYHSDNDAVEHSTVPSSGEWSIRLYSLESGASDIYDAEVVTEVEKAWKAMMTNFGNDDC